MNTYLIPPHYIVPLETMGASRKYCGHLIENDSPHVCCREVWNDERCIVHAQVSQKPFAALAAAKGPTGNLDGLYLKNEYFNTGEIFEGSQIHGGEIVDCEFDSLVIEDADFRGTTFCGTTLTNVMLRNVDLRYCTIDGDCDFSYVDAPRLDVRGADLSDANFRSAVFTDAIFDGAVLARTILINASLEETSARNSDLSGAALRSASLSGADLRGCEAVNATLNSATLNDVDLSEADLSKASLEKAVLDEGNLRECVLDEATLNGVEATGANLYETSLYGVLAQDASFNGADFSGADLRDGDFAGASFRSVTLREGQANEANLSGVDLSGSDLVGAHFDGVSAADLKLTDVEADDTKWREASLTGSDLAYALLNRADFTGADLSNATLSNATLCDATLKHLTATDISAPNANISDADFTGSNLRGADLRGSFAERAIFNRVNLFGAKLNDTALFGVLFTEAQINGQTSFSDVCPYEKAAGDDLSEGVAAVEESLTKAASVYRRLQILARYNEQSDLLGENFVKRKEVKRNQYRSEGKYLRWISATLSYAVFRYGESPWHLAGVSAFIIIFSAALFPLGLARSSAGELQYDGVVGGTMSFLDGLHLSLRAFTGFGTGPYTPIGLGHALVIMETVFGLVLFALFVFVLGRRSTR